MKVHYTIYEKRFDLTNRAPSVRTSVYVDAEDEIEAREKFIQKYKKLYDDPELCVRANLNAIIIVDDFIVFIKITKVTK